jgi:hypothetical protein
MAIFPQGGETGKLETCRRNITRDGDARVPRSVSFLDLPWELLAAPSEMGQC